MRRNLSGALLSICLVAALHTARAYARPPLLAEIRRFASYAASSQDNDKRREQFEFLTTYLPDKISRYEDRCEYKAELQVLLIRAHLELDEERAARKAVLEMMHDYRASNRAQEFTRWLTYKVQDCRARGKKRWVGLFEEVAEELNIELQDPRKLLPSADRDGDGTPNGQERCAGYPDDRDADQDGVPDGCDLCWGFPDDPDEDRDGIADGCDHCPGKPDWDGDLDGVPDGCDNCVGYWNPLTPRPEDDPLHDSRCECRDFPGPQCCWQPDEDGDGSGDPCDFTKVLRTTAVSDRAGRVRTSFEYNERGDLTRSVKWESEHQAMMITHYHYDEQRRMTGFTSEFPNTSHPPRKTKLFYDERGNFIGQIALGEENQGRFVYRDERHKVIKVTTAIDPPEDAIVLERFQYNSEGRLLKREVRQDEQSPLLVMETRVVRSLGLNEREEEIRMRVGPDKESLEIKHYKDGRLISVTEYPEPISPRGAAPSGEPLTTRFDLDVEWNEKGQALHQWHVTIRPSGVREVHGWRIEGEPYAPGSRKISERFTTRAENPVDEQKSDLYREEEAFFEPENYYYAVATLEPDGRLTRYTRDPEHPERVVLEEVREPAEDGFKVIRNRYKFNEAGQVVEERHSSPEGERVVSYDFDRQGRMTFRSTDDGRSGVEEHYRYNALDEQVWSFNIMHTDAFSVALPGWWPHLSEEAGLWRLAAFGSGLGCRTSNEEPEQVSGSLTVERLAQSFSDLPLSKLARQLIDQRLQDGKRTEGGRIQEESVTLFGRIRAQLSTVRGRLPDGTSTCTFLLLATHDGARWSLWMEFRGSAEGIERLINGEHYHVLHEFLTSFCFDRSGIDRKSLGRHLDSVCQPM